MRTRVLNLSGFMNHSQTRIDLPDHGVVLVTGDNGSGKSSLAEAVSVAGWNRTLRGTSPWTDGVEGCAAVETERFELSRTRSAKGAVKLSFMPQDGEAFDFQRSQIAQEELETVIGPWDVWRRTHVFSSQDAAHFTLAADADRKRLVECLLGVAKFDGALKSCRTDIKTNDGLVSKAERDKDVAKATRAALGKRQSDAEATLAMVADAKEPEETPEETAELEAQDEKLHEMVSTAAQDITAARQALRRLDRQVADAEAAVKQAQKRADFFMQDRCPTCEQPIPKKAREAAVKVVYDAKADAQAEKQRCTEEKQAHEDEIEELEEAVESLREQRRQVQDKLASAQADARRVQQERATWQRQCQQREAAERALATVGKELADVDARVAKAEEGLSKAQSTAAELAAVEKVLGLQGVRAQVLSKALGGIEAVANRWLAEIAGPGFELQLKPYTEKKTGGVNDKISLDVSGAGGGHGYKASSGGERRRLDVAILLALAEVSAAAHGQEQGTLWFDEVFDTLDAPGVEAVTVALGELSSDRVVVVISHAPELLSKLRPALHVHMTEGVAAVRAA